MNLSGDAQFKNNMAQIRKAFKKNMEQLHSISTNKVQTAEDFRFSKLVDSSRVWKEEDIMKEFAKLHVEAQAAAIIEQIKTKKEIAHFPEGSYEVTVVDKESILNAYPLTNIK